MNLHVVLEERGNGNDLNTSLESYLVTNGKVGDYCWVKHTTKFLMGAWLPSGLYDPSTESNKPHPINEIIIFMLNNWNEAIE